MTQLPDADPAPARGEAVVSPRWMRVALWAVPVLVLGAAAVGLVLIVTGEPDRPPETLEIIVPAGTQHRLAAGEDVTVMPTRIELRVGDRLLIRNEDHVDHSVGPYRVGAGREMVFEYGAAGVYEGYCPLSEGERYEIVVTT